MKRKLKFILVCLICFTVASTTRTTALQRPQRKASLVSCIQQRSQSGHHIYQVLPTESIKRHHVYIDLRGGGAPGLIATLFRTMVRNPVLLLRKSLS